MWFILHFYVLRYLRPHSIYNLVACAFLLIKSIMEPWKMPSTAVMNILCMYIGFLIYPSLIEFCFVPYYVISICGFRNRDYYVFVGSILLGIHLSNMTTIQIMAHVSMNLGRSLPTKASHLDFLIAHLIMFLLQPKFDFDIVDMIAGVSACLVHMFPDNMDLFSASMMFDSMGLLKVLPLHVLEMDWYLYYKNNYYCRVYNTYNFIVPAGVLTWALYNSCT